MGELVFRPLRFDVSPRSPVLGLILDCTWTDQGVGILYDDEQVAGVREQTIVPF